MLSHEFNDLAFVWSPTNNCIHSDERVSRNAAVGSYKNKLLNKCDKNIIMHLLLHFYRMVRDMLGGILKRKDDFDTYCCHFSCKTKLKKYLFHLYY